MSEREALGREPLSPERLAERIADYAETALSYGGWSKREAMLEAVRLTLEDAQLDTLAVLGMAEVIGQRDALLAEVDRLNAELADERENLAEIFGEVAKTYDHVTGGLISKPNTLAVHVIAAADDECTKAADPGVEKEKNHG